MTKWNLEAADSKCLLLAFDEGGVSGMEYIGWDV